jgi:hypothetical protein
VTHITARLQSALDARQQAEADHLDETVRQAELAATRAELDAAVAGAANITGQGTSPGNGKETSP